MSFESIFNPAGHGEDARLQAAIQMAGRAATDWEGKGMRDAPLTIACATPHAGHIISAAGFPDVPAAEYDRDDMVTGLIGLIEAPVTAKSCAVIAGAIAVLLGAGGCRAYLDDVVTIRARGEVPVLLFCIASTDAILATSVGISSKPTLH